MSDSLRAEDMGGQSAASSAVRFAEYMAEKLAAGRVALAFDDHFSRRRLSSEETVEQCQKVWLDVCQGARVSVAIGRHGVSRSAFSSWCRRQGIKVRQAKGKANS